MIQNASRLKMLKDLTRWNRAGVSRFDYVDGDAAVWLEELRIATMGLFARGAEFDERLPETWRGRFGDDKDQWPTLAERAAFLDALAWKGLVRDYPDKPETARRRNSRLMNQYDLRSGDYSWEIMRAAARASHVLLGHLNAYANEGYIRTATQWENLARLAAMVNYQPAPPTSATTTVGLIVEPTDDGNAVEINRGLAMKYTPPEGGAPVVFETLAPLKVHPGLNAVRAVGWNADPDPLKQSDDWLDNGEADLAPGTLGVLVGPDALGMVDAVVLSDVTRDEKAGTARIALDQVDVGRTRGNVELHLDAKDVRRALPRSTDDELVLKIDTASNYAISAPVKLHYGKKSDQIVVTGNSDGHLRLTQPDEFDLIGGEPVTVEALVPVTNTGSGSLAPVTVGLLAWYLNSDGELDHGNGVYEKAKTEDGTELSANLGVDFSAIVDASGSLYVETEGAKRESAVVVGNPPQVVPGDYRPKRIVSFSGKPPKGLTTGDLMVCRPDEDDGPMGLRIVGVDIGDDMYSIQFHRPLTSSLNTFKPDSCRFYGPMLQSLKPLNHDRNPHLAFDGQEVFVEDPGPKARELVRLGKKGLIEDSRGLVAPVLATLVEAVQADGGLRLVFEPAEGLPGFLKGWTTLNLNAVAVSHGETKSAKVLGSGDAEKPFQRFSFSARKISFVPSSVAETGVAPDMDVVVDGALWHYRDLIDPSADGSESYSVSQSKEGDITVHFRRRLPTGTDNVVVRRYRTGVGPTGTIPARVFDKPMKKHRYVRGVTQPIAAAGGADREPVEDIRVNAPSRLAANGRAVSLRDFERLCRRRSDVWQASARLVTDPSASKNVAIVIVPANGGVVGPTLREDLVTFVEARALPGVRVVVEDFVPVRLIVEATVRVDVEAYDKTLVQTAAQEALTAEFALSERTLGQPVYISEVAAALERVTGVETATVQTFSVASFPAILRTAKTGDTPSAYFPFDNQVISAAVETAGADMAIAVEAI